MKKYLVVTALIPAFLLMAGAGCEQLTKLYQKGGDNGGTQPNGQINTTPPPVQSSLMLTVNALNQGIVQLKWETPNNFNVNHTFFLLHSAKAEPVYPGAFYFRKGSTDREATWGNIPAGKRYFRVCEADGNACLNYSNVVELDVQ